MNHSSRHVHICSYMCIGRSKYAMLPAASSHERSIIFVVGIKFKLQSRNGARIAIPKGIVRLSSTSPDRKLGAAKRNEKFALGIKGDAANALDERVLKLNNTLLWLADIEQSKCTIAEASYN